MLFNNIESLKDVIKNGNDSYSKMKDLLKMLVTTYKESDEVNSNIKHVEVK